MTGARGLVAAGRAQLFAAIFVLAVLNGIYFTAAESVRTLGWAGAFLNFFSISAIIWIALVAIWQMASDEPSPPPSRRDLAVLAGAAALCLLPSGWEARIALLLASAYLCWASGPRTPERRIAIVALSVTAPLIWGRLALQYLSPELLTFDAVMAGLLTGHEVHGNTVTFAPGALADAGKRMVVLAGCSSFANISLSVVVTALVSQILDVPIRARIVLLALLLAASALVINLLRLATIASFPDRYQWLHVGTGATLFGYAGLIAMGAIALTAVRSGWLRAHA